MVDKRPCKFCGQVHNHCPFTDCHDPSQPLPNDLQDSHEFRMIESCNYGDDE